MKIEGLLLLLLIIATLTYCSIIDGGAEIGINTQTIDTSQWK